MRREPVGKAQDREGGDARKMMTRDTVEILGHSPKQGCFHGTCGLCISLATTVAWVPLKSLTGQEARGRVS